ncbi:MAG TPA: winged helix-turn-helix domain-containing protein [Pyrinomonadaceae bacterium]|nr:winged helix-turn-helix domain-containing protein [Pyrinomonadaceae bacterium]
MPPLLTISNLYGQLVEKGSALNVPETLTYEFGPFLLEPHARRLSHLGEPVPLPAPEFEILLLLVRNSGRVVEKNEIMSAVWPDVEVEENNLTVRMSSLRRSLGETKGHHPYIQTVTGRGYCLIVPVKELSAEPGTQTSSISVPVTPRKWENKGIRLYALLILGLLVPLLIYGVIRQRRAVKSQPLMKMTRVTHTGRVAWAAVSPDGQNIAYVERDAELHSLWLQRAGTNSPPLQLLPPAKLIYKELAFSPDGNTLYYSKCQPSCKLHRMPVFGGVETALSMRADSPVTFSPDGKRMAYIRSEAIGTGIEVNLLVANADGTGEETLNSRAGGTTYQGGAPAWSPDGKMIAVSIMVNEGGRSYMKVIGIGVADRAESTLSTHQWRWIKDVSWLPDGTGFIINGRDDVSAPDLSMQIWQVPLAGGEARRITNDLNNYMRSNVSADGRTLIGLQVQWTSGLSLAPADNPGAAVQVTQGTIDRQDGNQGVSITPDAKLVYVSLLSGKSDLWSINVNGSGLRQLTDGSHRDYSPVVTPDGRYIVFDSTRDGAHSLWRMDADGRNLIRLTRGRQDVEPVCTPDGKWVLYVAYDDRSDPKLRKVPIEGGESVLVTDEFAQHPTISPDGKVIAYHFMDKQRRERREIVLIPAQGGAPIKRLSMPKNFGAIMRWAPAGNFITYRDSTLSSLWRLPLDGTAPSVLINLGSERLHSFSYSYDGRQLAYSSGPTLSDVVMITHFN